MCSGDLGVVAAAAQEDDALGWWYDVGRREERGEGYVCGQLSNVVSELGRRGDLLVVWGRLQIPYSTGGRVSTTTTSGFVRFVWAMRPCSSCRQLSSAVLRTLTLNLSAASFGSSGAAHNAS